jgi:hypothetical protein
MKTAKLVEDMGVDIVIIEDGKTTEIKKKEENEDNGSGTSD